MGVEPPSSVVEHKTSNVKRFFQVSRTSGKVVSKALIHKLSFSAMKRSGPFSLFVGFFGGHTYIWGLWNINPWNKGPPLNNQYLGLFRGSSWKQNRQAILPQVYGLSQLCVSIFVGRVPIIKKHYWENQDDLSRFVVVPMIFCLLLLFPEFCFDFNS